MDLGFLLKVFRKRTSNAVEMSTKRLADLPNEMLEVVFSYLSSVERQKFRPVCRNWEAVVNEIFGIKLVIGNANHKLMFSSFQWAVEVEFDSITKSIIDKIVIADKVKKITFRQTVVFHNLISIFRACKNVQKLCFREVVVAFPEGWLQMLTTEISLLELKNLELHSQCFYHSWITILSFILKLNFGQLEEITIVTEYSPILPINFIFMRLPTKAMASNPDIHPLIRLVIKNIRTLKSFSFGTSKSPFRMKFYPFKLFGSQQLEEVEIPSFQAHFDWTTCLHNQTHLKKLEVGDWESEEWGEIRNVITRNASTLRKVNLIKIRGREFELAWNCSVFQSTHLLEMLSLTIIISQKMQLDFLPISLTFLDLCGPISLTELVKILNLVALEKLFLKCLEGNPANQIVDCTEKIDLQLFQRFVHELPRLKILAFLMCSSNALAWDDIRDWCLRMSRVHQINFPQFPPKTMKGGERHTICLTFPDNIISNRGVLLEDPFDDPLDYLDLMSIVRTACFSALGF